MNFVLMMALTAIASPCMQYDNCEAYKDNIINRLKEQGCCVDSNASIINNELFDTSGVNRYCYSDIQDVGTVIFDKQTQQIVKQSEFGWLATDFSINDSINIFDSTENEFYCRDFSTNDVNVIGWYDPPVPLSYNPIELDDASKVPEDVIFCQYHEYFYNLKTKLPTNYSKVCGVVSLSIVLGYYDNFINDEIVDEEYDDIYKNDIPFTSYKNISESPGVFESYKNLIIDEALSDLNINCYEGFVGFDQHASVINNRNKKLKHKANITYKNSEVIGKPLTKSLLKGVIDSGRPVIFDNAVHSMIAYGYNNDYLFLHLGYYNHGYITKLSWSDIDTSPFAFWDLKFTTPEDYTDNYYDIVNDRYLDPLTYRWHYKVNTIPEDYCFHSQYYFHITKATHSFNDLFISSERLRCGFIEEKAINLSPCRKGAGKAYLELTFNRPVHKFNVMMSYWSGKKSNLNDKITVAIIETRTNTEHWSTSLDLLKINDLSKDVNNPTEIKLHSKEGFRSIKFYMEGIADGDSNAGRMSITSLYYFC